MLGFAFSATGGLSYHLIARRRARSLWAPFRAQVRDWLTNWFAELDRADSLASSQPGTRRSLIVFGPSAGWTLPLDLFAQFSRVIFVEPDPIARFLLRRRLPRSLRTVFISRSDLLPWTSSRPGIFGEFLKSHADAAVLFSNVLGQLPLVAKQTGESPQREFLESLAKHNWASYHDLFSGSSIDAGTSPAREPTLIFSQGKVVDHETSWLRNSTSQLALWPLTEKTLHSIEFVRFSPSRGPDCDSRTSI